MPSMTWHWTPIPYLDATSGLSFGELILNGVIYAVALVAVLGVLAGLATMGRAFTRGLSGAAAPAAPEREPEASGPG